MFDTAKLLLSQTWQRLFGQAELVLFFFMDEQSRLNWTEQLHLRFSICHENSCEVQIEQPKRSLELY